MLSSAHLIATLALSQDVTVADPLACISKGLLSCRDPGCSICSALEYLARSLADQDCWSEATESQK
jgi:hypothetical protein